MMANYKGSLPSGEAFGTEKEDKKQAAAIRKAAAAKMATKTSPMDVIGDLAPYAGAIIGGVASGGNPQAIQAGYEGGKALGGMVGGDQERREEVLSEATEEEIQECYQMSWELGLKANALYRDGSKLSQPLSTKSDSKEDTVEESKQWTEEEVLDAARSIIMSSKDTIFKRRLSRVVERKKLPAKRAGFTQKSKIGGQTLFVRTGEYDDGTLGEIFIDLHKEGASFRSLVNCFAIAVSIGLQYGVPLEEFVDKFTFTRFEPSGPVDHENIKFSTSIVDYIFRLMAFEYLDRKDLVHVAPEEIVQQEKSTQDLSSEARGEYPAESRPASKKTESVTEKTEVKVSTETNFKVVKDVQSQANGTLMGDAPPCPKCGHTTIRNGTCYKCLNCGESLGCS